MIGNYFIEDVSLYIKEINKHGETYYRVCFASSDGFESGYIKDFKYYGNAKNYIDRAYKNVKRSD